MTYNEKGGGRVLIELIFFCETGDKILYFSKGWTCWHQTMDSTGFINAYCNNKFDINSVISAI